MNEKVFIRVSRIVDGKEFAMESEIRFDELSTCLFSSPGVQMEEALDQIKKCLDMRMVQLGVFE